MDDNTAKTLTQDLTDELNDVIKYCDLAMKTPNDDYANYFAQIAQQEMDHFDAIVEILQDAGKYQHTDALTQLKSRAEQSLAAV